MPGRAAAFFDLDRTVLVRSCAPVLNDALVAAGVIPHRPVPGQCLLEFVYNVVGETLPTMVLARGAARLLEGCSRTAVRGAAASAVRRLETLVAPYVRFVFEEHRAVGRPLVLATTTPRDLVEPLAERLGFDDVVATEYATRDGLYTGELDGEFVWARAKLAAVQQWAAEHDVDLRSSFAYSDSHYDYPLLAAVGHPCAVNPDVRLRLAATLQGWPVRHFDAPPWVPKLGPYEPLDLIRFFAHPDRLPFVRFDVAGLEHLPLSGPGIVVANHRSYFDPVAMGLVVSPTGRRLRFLGKQELLDIPLAGPLPRSLGTIGVDRGLFGAAVSLAEATLLLRAGELVALMPQGTIPRGRSFYEPRLVGKTGAARLASATGAPVIPMGLWGTEAVWPRNARLPDVLNVGSPPTVRIRIGPPVELAGPDVRSDTGRIMKAIVDLLPNAAHQSREPTEEELRRAMPP